MNKTYFSFTFKKLCVLFLLFVCFVSPVYSAKKCTRTLKRIPVHKGFDLNKFAGTWFTVTRTTFAWGDYTFESFSLEIEKAEDGSFGFSYTGQIGDKCLPVESGKLVKNGRPGQYTLRTNRQTSDNSILIISFTDYKNLALVYYCFKFRPGSRAQCQKNGMQIEIISKQLNPNKKDVNGYIKRSGKRLCVQASILEATQPGLCKVPEILAAAKQRAKDLKEADPITTTNDQCAVNNIPLQKHFNSSQLAGLWYEIARTRFTFNKMESVVNFHRYDESTNQIYSYYTGTIVNPEYENGTPYCMTAIQGMSRTVEDSDSDRLGKIGWDDDSFQWSPTKVIYADDDYILFYACYSGETDEPCNQYAMEVTLSGRSRDISDEKRNAIYSILENCIKPGDMVETKFLANCSEWVTIQPEKIQPEDCKLDEIVVYDDYISTMMAGTWYLYSSISYDNMTSLNGVIMEKTLTSGTEGIDTRIVAFSPDMENCTEYRSRSRDMCIDTADHIALVTNGDGNFVFSKVLYLDEELLVEYVCNSRTLDGKCDRNGIQFNVFSKNDTTDEDFILTDEQQDMINVLAKRVCLDPNDIQLQSVWCNMTDATNTEKNTDMCDIDAITVFSDVNEYSQEMIYGYWYEISRSSASTYKPPVRSAVAYFTSPSNETLNIYYTGFTYVDSYEGCSEVLHASMIARCSSDINGDSLYRFNEAEHFVSYIPYKIIYTDYKNVLVTYMCTKMLEHGQCSKGGEEIVLWSRNETLDEEFKQETYEVAFWVCLQPEMVDIPNKNYSCRSNLEEYVTENQIGIYEDYDVSDDSDEDDEDEDGDGDDDDDYDEGENNAEQNDQGKNKYELSDIDELLLMDDDEFYYNS
ncbi:uncharacterized protein LOC132717704 [Ruditapes philippinarum]|uniref:uncharacterized protein LOC132717704 n=1 Tax=Ruditapes philippinarum TaxID=129788 RepID=UPI00295B1BBD|nr:uncharacterized protein LOC132717704 [Ruditapes philippinarum]